jgi:chromosome segregation ATPase
MNAFLLSLRHDIEQLKDGRVNLLIKASNQEIIIDRMKTDAMRLKMESDALRADKKRAEDERIRCHQKEVQLTAERDTFKRELELVREVLRKADSECAALKGLLDCERAKRQKMRGSYRRLNESLNGGDTDQIEVRGALDELQKELMG